MASFKKFVNSCCCLSFLSFFALLFILYPVCYNTECKNRTRDYLILGLALSGMFSFLAMVTKYMYYLYIENPDMYEEELLRENNSLYAHVQSNDIL